MIQMLGAGHQPWFLCFMSLLVASQTPVHRIAKWALDPDRSTTCRTDDGETPIMYIGINILYSDFHFGASWCTHGTKPYFFGLCNFGLSMLSFRSPFVAKFTRKGTGRLLTKNLFLFFLTCWRCAPTNLHAEFNEIQCFSPMHEKHWELPPTLLPRVISEGSSFVDINTCKSTTYYFLYS